VRFHYRREGTGPAVLLLHGGGTWSYSYRDTVEVLAKRYTVIAVDLPGHGYTEVTDPAFEYDLPAVTDALRDLLDELDVPDVAAVGHSWGGGIALAMAQRHPSRVRRLALIGSSGLDVEDTLTWRLLGTPVVGEILSKLVRRQDVRSGLEQSFHHRDLVDDAMVDEVWPPLTFTGNRRAQYLLQRRLDWTQTQAALPGTATPTLVLWGRQDAYLSADHAARFQELMPDARAQVIDQCGHSAHEECPDEVNTALLKFLT
jgi:pimeloyl-ACP methyl ester carboxylesterase